MRRLLTIILFVPCLFASAQGDQNLDGVWEGEIQDPSRPVVINVDFRALRVSFSGAAPVNITGPALSAGDKTVRFEIVNGRQTLKFAGRQDGGRIAGDVDTSTRRIPFWLEILPSFPKPADRREAWRQDIDVVLSRFLPGLLDRQPDRPPPPLQAQRGAGLCRRHRRPVPGRFPLGAGRGATVPALRFLAQLSISFTAMELSN